MIKYLELCEVLERIESIQSRNEMTEELSEFLKQCNGEEVEIVSYMIQGRVAPMFVEAEFNYSEKSLINLLKEYTPEDVGGVRDRKGDIGDAVYEIWENYSEKGKDLYIKDIYGILWNIINTKGNGSVSRKNKIVLDCLKKLNTLESKYFVRTICGDLRLGLSEKSLLDVFSVATMGDKGLKNELERSYGVCSDIGYVGKVVFESKEGMVRDALAKITAIPGNPILSRLVQRVGGFEELMERFEGELLLQPKFDGLRCQIHKWKGGSKQGKKLKSIWRQYLEEGNDKSGNLFSEKISDIQVRLFTRNLEDVTKMFPEIVESAKKIERESFILDSEIVGWDYQKNNFLSYQETMQRRRKHLVEAKKTDIPVKAFVFDLLYLEGKPLIKDDTKDRIEMLNNILIREGKGEREGIVLAETKSLKRLEDIKQYFNKCIDKGLEGIIVKDSKGGYVPGARNYEWIKMKRSIDEKLVDTVDMVVVGYYKGSGRRSKFGLGAILGAVFNAEVDKYDAICKIGTGMTDDLLREIYEKLSDISCKSQPKNVRVYDTIKPDVWVSPKYVITVDADEITRNISNNETGVGGGLSLRFPRLIEFDRKKGVENITTVKEMVDMYEIKK